MKGGRHRQAECGVSAVGNEWYAPRQEQGTRCGHRWNGMSSGGGDAGKGALELADGVLGFRVLLRRR
ncbi:hypothetical protein GCM10018987_10640 [Streptomyces cremeus]